MKPPTFEQIEPWARRMDRISGFCLWLGAANNVAMFFVRPELTSFQLTVLALWWAPIAAANAILNIIMIRWAIARLRAYQRDHPELFK
jgi:hypothetical protein